MFQRAYHQSLITKFINKNPEHILGHLSKNHLNHSLEDNQRNDLDFAKFITRFTRAYFL